VLHFHCRSRIPLRCIRATHVLAGNERFRKGAPQPSPPAPLPAPLRAPTPQTPDAP